MKFYFYEKTPAYGRGDTDRLILESLRQYAAETARFLPPDVTVRRSPLGKPYLPEFSPALFVGVTHTDKTVVIAFDEKPFGIDCESNSRRVRRRESVMRRFFSEKEQQYVRLGTYASDALETYDRSDMAINRRFLEIWVKKEAYVKYLGIGLAALASADTFTIDQTTGYFEKIPHGDDILYYFRPSGKG